MDCSEVFGGVPNSCRPVPCPGEYKEFSGTWTSQFQAYVREPSRPENAVFRPYTDTVTYADDACLANPQSGETLIVGHRKDVYPAFQGLPAKEETGLLMMGTKADGTRFLRTDSRGRLTEFGLTYGNRAADLAIWTAHVPASANGPEMTITTIDARALELPAAHKRKVSVTMAIQSI